MGNEFAQQPGHSAEYFGESRDYWWNDDFLALQLKRWVAADVRTLLDVGCGVGHWGRAWARVLPPGVQVTGVDRDPNWVTRATEIAARAGLRFNYEAGLAEKLPFAADSFDFTTCQTVLMHLADAQVGLKEMIRVTRPGGLIVAAEPNNAAVPFLEDALAAGLSSTDTERLMGFHLTCVRGKAALGHGDETIGRTLLALFRAAGLENISVCQNEKSCPLAPPYESMRERAILAEHADWNARDFWIWDRAQTARYFAAGGGAAESFELLRDLAIKAGRQAAEAVKSGTYVTSGGALFYLVAGRKPGQPTRA